MNFATVLEERYENSRFAQFYTNSFALIRDSFALIREKYNFFPYEIEPNGTFLGICFRNINWVKIYINMPV